jgi:hypothetical protein
MDWTASQIGNTVSAALQLGFVLMLEQARAELAPTGVLRAGINMSNFLLGKTGSERVLAPAGPTPCGRGGGAYYID